LFCVYYTERPYQDRSAAWYGSSNQMFDLSVSNGEIDPELMRGLYGRYFTEKLAVEAAGFDGVLLNSHHATPFSMSGGVTNLEAAVLAQITERIKIVLMGNLVPTWEDPIHLLEELSFVDVLSGGRLVSGFVRGTGRESLVTNANPTYNWERFQEAHDLIVKAWTTPGPFRWEGTHFQYRYVNPWFRPYQQPHVPIWTAGIVSRATIEWAAARRYPYIMLDSQLHLTQQVAAFYREEAQKNGFEAGPEHLGYMLKVHVDDTEEKAYEVGRSLIEGVGNIFVDGSNAHASPWVQNLPGMNTRKKSGFLPTVSHGPISDARGIGDRASQMDEKYWHEELSPDELLRRRYKIWNSVLERKGAIVGTPDSVIKQLREVFEIIRPGTVVFWNGDGDMRHEDAMRNIGHMGNHVLPAVHEMAGELGLPGAFEVDPRTGAKLGAMEEAVTG
jgi:alkanesulfonate monooxygenase SsuD/methylene tetrahydromethanopterin reductase-like flavin-dependent oxidoreductase (luciferase family)